MYCKHCGKSFTYKEYVCPHCQHDYSTEDINQYFGERAVFKVSGIAFLTVIIVTIILQVMQPFQKLISFMDEVPVLNVIPNLISVVFGILQFALTFVSYGLFVWAIIGAIYNKKHGRSVNILYVLMPILGIAISELSIYSASLLFTQIVDPIFKVLGSLVEADYSLSYKILELYNYLCGPKLVATDIICLVIFLLYGLSCFGAYALNKTLNDSIDFGAYLTEGINGVKLVLNENKQSINTAAVAVGNTFNKVGETIKKETVNNTDRFQNITNNLNDNYLVKEESSYDGTAMGMFTAMIGPSLLTLITFGICTPFFLDAVLRYQYNHTIISGRRLKYTGNGKTLFGSYIKWTLLHIITLGIYSIWIPKKLMDYQAAHLFWEDEGAIDGNSNPDSIYLGTTGETFLDNLIGVLLGSLSGGLLTYGGTHYFQQKVRSKLVIGGVPLKCESNWTSYIGKYIVDMLLSVVTMGIWTFKASTNLLKNICVEWYIYDIDNDSVTVTNKSKSKKVEAIEERNVQEKQSKRKVNKVETIIDEEEIDLDFDEEEEEQSKNLSNKVINKKKEIIDEDEEEIDLDFDEDEEEQPKKQEKINKKGFKKKEKEIEEDEEEIDLDFDVDVEDDEEEDKAYQQTKKLQQKNHSEANYTMKEKAKKSANSIVKEENDEEEIDLDFDDVSDSDSDFEDASDVEVNEEEEKRKTEALKKAKRKQVVNDDEYDMVPVNRNSKIKQGKKRISRVHNVLEDEEDLDIDEDVSNVESELKPTIKVSKIGRHMKS